jgi:hypothetical protein
MLIYHDQMSSFSRYGVAATGGVVLVILLHVLVIGNASGDARLTYSAATRLTLYAAAAIAAAMAASKFGWWRERIGLAWTFFAVEFFLLFVNYVMRRVMPNAEAALDATLIVVNIAQIAAYWLMARALDAAGIGYLMSRGNRILLTIGALVVAIALCQPTLAEEWEAIRSGQFEPGSILAAFAVAADIARVATILA